MTSPDVDEQAKKVVTGLRLARARARHKSFWANVGKRIRSQLLAGVVVVVPVGATVLILKWVFEWVDDILQPIIRTALGRPIYGLGFGITFLVIWIVGIIASQIGGRRLIQYAESLVNRIPVVKHMVSGIKQILEAFASPRETGFMQVVLVEYPRKGLRTLAFITNEEYDSRGEKLLNVFIPTAPNPTSGFLHILRESEVMRTDIAVDDALKMIVSAGRVSARELNVTLAAELNDNSAKRPPSTPPGS
ncbi:MAG: DUF502 domain-containing protein [Dehalococcoidia bacterium]|nr:DUF502 domain-containing protein [Dehalococcoidia bacterium]